MKLDNFYWLMYKGVNPNSKLSELEAFLLKFIYPIANWSIKQIIKQEKTRSLIESLQKTVPDISEQETHYTYKGVIEEKERAVQAFQCQFLLEIMSKASFQDKEIFTLVDIGDSSGTHCLYFSELLKDKVKKIETISVNLDPKAIEKIKSRGLKAILCRAEDLDLGSKSTDLFTSFQMLEHLHDPVMFLRRLAKKSKGNYLFVTVPYFEKSRVGLHRIRNNLKEPVSAEETHIFELSPEDWNLLFIHSGWKPIFSKKHYHYPRNLPVVSLFLKYFWRILDFEGYWGIFLEKDLEISNYYQDWDE
ncbi:MAG: class I SAM-dependent methyltransferase [Okeania sp. SIO3B3]|nr:class I SAM-dependent methyltransferase [Okeania sp. SIO3B3]